MAIHRDLREQSGKNPEPSAAMIDTQSVKTSQMAESNYHHQRWWLVLIVLKGTLLLVYLNRLSCFCSISFSLRSCHFTYSLICFSFRPTVLTQYPRLHKCRPQYRFPNLSYRWNNLNANFPFKKPIIDETEYFGGTDITRWIWSSWIFSICWFSILSALKVLFHTIICYL